MPINDYFIFDGKNSLDYGLHMASDPTAIHPARRGDLFPIPGRNGSIVREDGSYDTYTITYDVLLDSKDKASDVYAHAREVAEWLLGSRGFCRLEDSYEPEYFRLARCAAQMSVENRLARFGRAQISFEVQPQRYLKSGESEIMIESNVSGSSSIAINNFAKNAKRVKLNVSQDASVKSCVGSLKIYKSDNPSDYISATMTEIAAPDDFEYTNVMDNSGAQFKAGLRYSMGSNAFVSNNNPACDAVVIPIPSNVSNIRIRVRNATFSTYNTIYGGTDGNTFQTNYGRYQVNPSPLKDENGDIYFDFENSGSNYITFNLAPVSDPSSLIVTVNEPIVKINADGIADYEGTVLIEAGYDSSIATVTEHGNPSARLVVLDQDGNEINSSATSGGQAVVINPTQFEARPLLKFVDTSEEPPIVPQTITEVENSYIAYNGELINVTWGAGYARNCVSISPVDVSGYAYALVSCARYAFYDSAGNAIFVSDREKLGQHKNDKIVIPSGASTIVIYTENGYPSLALSLQAARPNPGSSAATINGTTISLDFSVHDTIYLDCDLHDAYYIDGANANSAVTFESNVDDYPTFPGLGPGENIVIPGDGTILDFEIVPRWWTL